LSSIEALFGGKKPEEKQPQKEDVKPQPVIPQETDLFASPPPEPEKPQPPILPEVKKEEVIEKPKPIEQPKVTSLADMLAPPPENPLQKEVNPLTASGLSQFGSKVTDIPPPPLPEFPKEFDLTPESESVLRYITIFGGKNSSKTTLALSFPGKKTVLSFDHKTVPTWISMFLRDKAVTIYDAIRYMDYSSPEATLISSEITFRYINTILDKIKTYSDEERPDWFIIDGLEEYTKISENVMRHRNNLGWTQGVEWQYWKSRRLYIKQLFLKLSTLVKQGVIFCTKYDFEEVIISGVTKEKRKKPNWIDIIEDQTDIQIETWSTEDKQTGEVRFFAHVTASKYAEFPTGKRADITSEPGKVDAFSRLYKGEIVK